MIRQLYYAVYGDDTDVGQEDIKNVSWDLDKKFITLGIDGTNALRSIQKNDIIYLQSAEGIYKVEYFCSFRSLVPSADIKNVTLGLNSLTFLPGQFFVALE